MQFPCDMWTAEQRAAYCESLLMAKKLDWQGKPQTKHHFRWRQGFRCITCEYDDATDVCCLACATICHKGHTLVPKADEELKAYCDCLNGSAEDAVKMRCHFNGWISSDPGKD